MKEVTVNGDQFSLILVNAPAQLSFLAQERARKKPGYAQPCGMDASRVVEVCREMRLPLPTQIETIHEKYYGIGVYARRIGAWRMTWTVTTR